MKPINLIPAARREAAAKRRRIRTWGVAVGALAGLVGFASLLVNLPFQARTPDFERDLTRIEERLQRASRRRDQAEATIRERQRAMEITRAVGSHPDWWILLRGVASAREDQVVLDRLTLTSEKVQPPAPKGPDKPESSKAAATTVYSLRLEGFTRGPAEAFEFAHRLDRLGVFDRVTVKDTRSQSLGEMPATRFEITGRLADAEGAAR